MQLLRRTVGEWTYESEAMTGRPEQPLEKGRGTESVRLVGNWAVFEGRVPTPQGTMTTLLTVGHDSRRGAPSATWVDSMTDMQWVYGGTVDETGTVLTLTAKGPNSQSAGRDFLYRSVLEVPDSESRVLRSEILTDGEWVTFLTARYSRVR